MKKPLFVILQYCLPQHALSRMIGCAMNSRTTWLKNALIKWFIKRYQVDMSLAAKENPKDYATFNDFFIRHLKPNSRSIAQNKNAIISPADGCISQLGKIQQNKIFQAKGIDYTLQALMGDEAWAKDFENGHFATVYLSPKDYHRVHVPFAGKLIAMRYIPGQLFSVNTQTTEHVPGLFSRNERAVCLFETEQGKMAVIMVGAMIVASIHTAWAGQVAPSTSKEIKTINYDLIPFNKGDEMGYFCLGSTAIVLFANQNMQWLSDKKENTAVIMGEQLGEF